mgnify:CR=1 FL=1
MATKKTTGSRKRREKKNIERGAAHIQSTFNNTIVTITDMNGTLFLGLLPEKWASVVQENQLRLLLLLLLKLLQRLLWSMV